MTYGALLIPNTVKTNKKEKSEISSWNKIKDKMMSGLKDGGLSFDNATTLLKNTASIITENKDAIMSKFCGIGLTQLLVDGKMTNKTAINYLKQGFPQALNQTAITMGFQSADALITALQNENGVNVKTFISAFETAGSALSKFLKTDERKKNVDGFQVIELDVVVNDTRSYNAETPDRRVESGQSYQEYLHNLPNTYSFECKLQEGKKYTASEFEDLILKIRESKTPIDIMLGDDRKKTCVITSFSPIRERTDGMSYSIELKQIDVGTISMHNVYETNLTKDYIENQVDENSTKTGGYLFKSFQQPKTSNLLNDMTVEYAKQILGE